MNQGIRFLKNFTHFLYMANGFRLYFGKRLTKGTNPQPYSITIGNMQM